MNIKNKIQALKPQLLDMIEQTNVILEKGHSHIKNYVYQEENVKHMSLMIYNTLPLAVRLGVKQEQFYEKFKIVFALIRHELFEHESIHVESIAKVEKEILTKDIIKTDIVKKDVIKQKVKRTKAVTKEEFLDKTSAKKKVKLDD